MYSVQGNIFNIIIKNALIVCLVFGKEQSKKTITEKCRQKFQIRMHLYAFCTVYHLQLFLKCMPLFILGIIVSFYLSVLPSVGLSRKLKVGYIFAFSSCFFIKRSMILANYNMNTT